MPAAQVVFKRDSGEKESQSGSDVGVGKALPFGLQFMEP